MTKMQWMKKTQTFTLVHVLYAKTLQRVNVVGVNNNYIVEKIAPKKTGNNILKRVANKC